MNYLNAFVLVNKMERYHYIGNHFIRGSKFLKKVSLVLLPVYIILAAINTGELVDITSIVLLLLVAVFVQSIVLQLAGTILIYIADKKSR
ncbi:hypothetical protein [Tannockella kyphosi]|uniref:hypothetical protein n=1 Tax=Tannockella kyphosi TaxID=2899121 RepID=UPI0020122D11|nr:hypothetical protein [Tannockella kyphosi]